MIRIALIILLCSMSIIDADKKCGEHERISTCGQMCEPTCQNPNPNSKLCPRLQCSDLISSCRCDEGYLRNQQKMCVAPEDCDNQIS